MLLISMLALTYLFNFQNLPKQLQLSLRVKDQYVQDHIFAICSYK